VAGCEGLLTLAVGRSEQAIIGRQPELYAVGPLLEHMRGLAHRAVVELIEPGKAPPARVLMPDHRHFHASPETPALQADVAGPHTTPSTPTSQNRPRSGRSAGTAGPRSPREPRAVMSPE